MPALTSEDQLIPRSTLRHRPIGLDVKLTEPPRIPRASRTQTQLPKAITTTPVLVGKSVKAQSSSWQQRLLLIGVGTGMILAILLVFVGQLLVGWVATGLDDLHYGRPRTYQVDAVVGQNDSPAHASHFIALNLNGQIEVIDFPGGDATYAKVYLGPHLYEANASLVPVTLQFVDRRHDHHPDMIVLIQQEEIRFTNGQGSFHAPAANS